MTNEELTTMIDKDTGYVVLSNDVRYLGGAMTLEEAEAIADKNILSGECTEPFIFQKVEVELPSDKGLWRQEVSEGKTEKSYQEWFDEFDL